MKSYILRWSLNIAILLIGLGMLAGLGMLVAALVRGEPLQTTLAMVIDPASARPVVASDAGPAAGSLTFDHATLTVRAGGLGYALAQGADILFTGGLLLIALLSLRRIVLRIAAGLPFDDGNIALLRTAGFALIGFSLWTWVSALLFPLALLPDIEVSGGRVALLPAISGRVAGMASARVDVHLDLGWLLAGIFLLLLAEAFRVGRDLRLDSEAIL